jgi:TctA family transporter
MFGSIAASAIKGAKSAMETLLLALRRYARFSVRAGPGEFFTIYFLTIALDSR